MKAMPVAFFVSLAIHSNAQSTTTTIPEDFVKRHYDAYSGLPTAERLAPFHHDEVVLEDPTYDWLVSAIHTQQVEYDVTNGMVSLVTKGARVSKNEKS